LDGCRQLLQSVAEELRAEQAVLILCNPLTRELEFLVFNQDPAVAQLYAEYYADLDPTGLPDYIKGAGCLPGDPPAHSVSDLMEVVDYGTLVATEFYNDFMKNAEIHYDLVAFVSPNSSTRGALCLHRARRCLPFSPEELAVLDILAPFVGNHLERMFAASLRSALPEAGSRGVIVCDTRGRVLFSNDIARILCSSLRQTAGSPSLIAEACFVGYTLGSPEILAESFDLGVSSRDVTLEHGDLGRIITLQPHDGLERRWSEPLKARFALTDREIEVLGRLMVGRSNREISQALFIAECTVKKHIQSISAKVGARTRTSIAHAVRQELGLTP
jgi:DNA-binding CsgD family transcriptional regulator